VQVESVSPAERAGLLLGDVILAADDATTNDVDDLRSVLRAKQAGQDVTLKILRAGAVKEVKASLTSAE
jgi:S1-C subfamily serine protease